MLLEHTICTAKLNEDCTVELMAQISDLGTGGHTVMTQMAAETLGFPMEDIHLAVRRFRLCPDLTSAPMQAVPFTAQAPAIIEACESVKKQLLERAAQLLEARVEDLADEGTR